MKILILAGATTTPIDPFRILTTTPPTRETAKIVAQAWQRGHELTILSSTQEVLAALPEDYLASQRVSWAGFTTSDELIEMLPQVLQTVQPDAIVSMAGLSEHHAAGLFRPQEGTHFSPRHRHWEATSGPPSFAETQGVHDAEQWVRLARAPRPLERLRSQWGYTGSLLAFRLEPEMADVPLVQAAEQFRHQIQGDIAIVSTPTGEANWSFVGPLSGRYDRLLRRELPTRVVTILEDLQRARGSHG
jgi:hypothetical protein